MRLVQVRRTVAFVLVLVPTALRGAVLLKYVGLGLRGGLRASEAAR
jgi:hypothetical protein